MKRYTLSLSISHTEKDFEDVGLKHYTESEIQQYMEGELEDLIQSSNVLNVEFRVEESK